jgi:hypothetical protein
MNKQAAQRWRLAAPLAGVEGERAVGTTRQRQCASRLQDVKCPWQTTWRIDEAGRWRSEPQAAALCRVDRAQVTSTRQRRQLHRLVRGWRAVPHLQRKACVRVVGYSPVLTKASVTRGGEGSRPAYQRWGLRKASLPEVGSLPVLKKASLPELGREEGQR